MNDEYSKLGVGGAVGCLAWVVIAVIILLVMGCPCCASWPRTGPIVDEVDLIEKNVMYDDEGRKVFIQWIFWESRGPFYLLVDWRMDSKCSMHAIHDGERFEVTWLDVEAFRKVRALSYAETHTQTDPEINHRAIQPQEFRRKLTSGKALQCKPADGPFPPVIEGLH